MCRFIETVLIKKGTIKNIEYHQKRIDLTVKKHFGKKAANLEKELLKRPLEGTYRCRITYSKKIEKIEFEPYFFKKRAKIKIVESDLRYSYKYRDRKKIDEYLSIAAEEGFDDCLFVSDGKIKDTSIANIAFFDGKRWITPKIPLLKGTTRERLIRSGFLKTEPIKKEDIRKYGLFALMNALSGFRIVGRVDLVSEK